MVCLERGWFVMACRKTQCRGRLPHSRLHHWVPLWAWDLIYAVRFWR